jgi:4-hydroxybenzoyl-CoA reductase subunit beta
MKMPPFKVLSPKSLDEALLMSQELSDSGEDFDWIAGGTDLLPNYKWHINVKSHVISLSSIPELRELSESHIGAMVSISELAEGASTHPVLAKAANSVASVLIRKSGTVGGNICLDTRCYWINQSETWRESIDWCHKCDCGTDADCRVIPNQNTLCVATYQADLAPVLMCLGATIHLASPKGVRSLPLCEFFELDGMKRNILEKGELVTHLTIPEDSAEWQGDYQKLRQRDSWDFPEAGVAVLWRGGSSGGPESLRVATTGLESIPSLHSEEAEEALSRWRGAETVEDLAESIRKAVKPVQNTWFSPPYRRKMVKVLTKRACRGLLVI